MAKSLKLIIEALLFASDKPLTARDIHTILPEVPLASINSALRVLKYEYEAMGRSFVLKLCGAPHSPITPSRKSLINQLLNYPAAFQPYAIPFITPFLKLIG